MSNHKHKETLENENAAHDDSSVGSIDDDEDVVRDVIFSQEENYDFEYWPKTDGPEAMDGCTFKSKDDDVIAAIEKVHQFISVKERVFEVNGITFTCKKAYKSSSLTFLDVLGQRVNFQKFTGKKKGHTLQINRAQWS